MGLLQTLRLLAASGIVGGSALLAGCGGGGGDPAPLPAPAPAPRFAVGGTVSGLTAGASVTLNNGSDSVIVAANGPFAFATKLEAGASYNVTTSNPAGQACRVTDSAAAIGGADVTKVAVKCIAFNLAGVESAIQFVAGLSVDATGNTFVIDSDRQVILKITQAGAVTVFAGASGEPGSVDGVGAAARFHFNQISRMAMDTNGNLAVSDSCNGTIRKITMTGVVTTLAGKVSNLCLNYERVLPERTSVDGVGAAAIFMRPAAIASDNAGGFLLVDDLMPTIRRISAAGVVTSTSYYDPAAGNTQPMAFHDITMDRSGNIFALGYDNLLYKIGADGKVVFLAGGAVTAPGNEPPDGIGAAAGFYNPQGIVADASGNIYVSDSTKVRKVEPNGRVSSIAGSNQALGIADGAGSAAQFQNLNLITTTPAGNLVAAELFNNTLRQITPAGVVTTLAATPVSRGYADGIGRAALFSYYEQPAIDADGNVYVADRVKYVIRKITPSGEVSLFAGIPGVHTGIDGDKAIATFRDPNAMVAAPGGVLYVKDSGLIRKIANGVVSRFAAINAKGMAVDADGNLAVTGSAGTGQAVYLITPAGVMTKIVDSTMVMQSLNLTPDTLEFFPQGVAFDAAGNLFISDTGHVVVHKYTKSGVLSTFAGTPLVEGDKDGPVGVATFGYYGVDSMASDPAGNLYLSGQGKMRKISPAGVVSTPIFAWGNPVIHGVAFGNGRLIGMTKYAVLQTPVP